MSQWLQDPAWWNVSTLIALGAALTGYLLVRTLVRVLGKRLERRAQARPASILVTLAAVVRATRDWLLFFLSLAIAAGFLDLSERLQGHIAKLIFVLIGIQLALWTTRFVITALENFSKRSEDPGNEVILGVVGWTTRLAVWVILLLAILSNSGVNVNAFIASLGVGGIAVALAAQNVLGDLFASVSIGLDKPFKVGDFIAFDDEQGTVKHVGIKSTRIQSLSGEELAIANAALIGKLVRNYGRMSQRRVAFQFGVALDTPREKIQALLGQLTDSIRQIERVRFDRGHLLTFAGSALNFEFVYYVLDADYTLYCDIQQGINFRILDLIEALQIRLAVPVREIRNEEPPTAQSQPSS